MRQFAVAQLGLHIREKGVSKAFALHTAVMCVVLRHYVFKAVYVTGIKINGKSDIIIFERNRA